ncbi:hypothetical protein [Planococcus citreus]|uniref:Uncharacterized protein n=1 Tax=Planococcus citreus TaxID=1373 RepID=A0A497YFL7_9BACL|nr:hypothetical protein [Planococcus citreus]RLJ86626.1 hypothetical protein DFR62_2228 [Planococcus citreus]
MKLPTSKELDYYLSLELLKQSSKGYNAKDVAIIVLDEYEYLSHKSDIHKFMIYTKIQKYCKENSIQLDHIDKEIKTLSERDSIAVPQKELVTFT